MPPNENEGMTVAPTNETTAHEETPIPPQVATLSEEECSDSEKPTRLPVEECIGAEDEDDDDCAEDAEAEQRRYEAKMDAADMKLLAEIDAREKQQKHSAQLLKNAELMKTIQEQNTAGNQNRTLSEIATLLGQSSNTDNTQTNVHNNEKNSIFQSNGMQDDKLQRTIQDSLFRNTLQTLQQNNLQNMIQGNSALDNTTDSGPFTKKQQKVVLTDDDEELMFNVKKKRVISENDGDKATNVIYTPDSVNEGYDSYNRKTQFNRVNGTKRSFITSEPFGNRDLHIVMLKFLWTWLMRLSAINYNVY